MLDIGQVAPDFSVTDHNGHMVQLSDFKGKNLVMWFYPKASTGG